MPAIPVAHLPNEIMLLGVALLIAIVNIMWAAQARTKQYGADWNMGARDADMPPLAPLPGRLLRAQANLMETLPLFAAAVLAAAVVGRLGFKTSLGAHLFVLARLVYLPLYAAGIPVVRTLVWMVSLAGLLIVIWGVFTG